MNILFGALSLVVLAAGSAAALTTEEAARLAVAHNPILAAARQQVVAAGGRADQARLWPNPELELNLTLADLEALAGAQSTTE